MKSRKVHYTAGFGRESDMKSHKALCSIVGVVGG